MFAAIPRVKPEGKPFETPGFAELLKDEAYKLLFFRSPSPDASGCAGGSRIG